MVAIVVLAVIGIVILIGYGLVVLGSDKPQTPQYQGTVLNKVVHIIADYCGFPVTPKLGLPTVCPSGPDIFTVRFSKIGRCGKRNKLARKGLLERL